MPLIRITPSEFNVELCIMYATDNNFTGAALYKKPYCYLHKDAIQCLKKAIILTSEIGLKIKIFDGFRPLEVQRILWEKRPDPEFISNPDTGRTPHCRGLAIDMTLINKDGRELDMGTDFDEFSKLSHHGNTEIPPECQRNRHILMGIMTTAGWSFNPNEWWHYQLSSPETYDKLTDKMAKTEML